MTTEPPDLTDPEAFVRHCVDSHGMAEETWFNIPTTRGYHAFLHSTKAASQDHTHVSDEQA